MHRKRGRWRRPGAANAAAGVLAAVLALAPAGPGAAWQVPAPGTPLRADLLDALRPHAEWLLGAPVEFVVEDLRAEGGQAFAAVRAQRPGGGAIDVAATPGARRGELDPELIDTPRIQALLTRAGRTWVAVHWALGPGDAWLGWDEMCRDYAPVIADLCGGGG